MLLQWMFVLQAGVALLGPVALAWWLRRRLGARWGDWGWGALAFIVSQVARTPFLLALTALLPRLGFEPEPTRAFWFNVAVLSFSAGLFEEAARWVVLRRLARNARRWRDGVMFGAGHGGIEAMLLVGFGAINALVILTLGDTLLAQTQAQAPEQLPAVAAQLEAVRALAWWMPLLALVERVFAIGFHIAASLLVLRAVRDGRKRDWWGAVGLHTVLNSVALIALQAGGAVAAEVALAAVSLLSLMVIVGTRRDDRTLTVGALER